MRRFYSYNQTTRKKEKYSSNIFDVAVTPRFFKVSKLKFVEFLVNSFVIFESKSYSMINTVDSWFFSSKIIQHNQHVQILNQVEQDAET